MDLLRWMGWMFARFVALSVAILGAWMFIANVADVIANSADVSYEGWVLAWILFSGVAGATGGSVYLLSVDGPPRFRSKRLRTWGWAGMLAAALLPTSLTLMLVPLVLVIVPTLFKQTTESAEAQSEGTVTSS
jgi:hypothetical protein